MPETFGFDEFFWARPLSTPLMIAVFAAVVLLSIFLYRRAWGLPLWLRVLLGVARLVALALVVASLFEPTGVVKESHTQARTLPVLIDVSESMSMKDQRKNPEDVADAAAALGMLQGEDLAPDRVAMLLNADQRQAILSASRLDLARGILTDPAAPVLEGLGDSLDISYHSFGRAPQVISDASTVTDDDLAALTASEPATSIAASLEAVAKSGVTTPAGIVLLTDGIDNASSQHTESVLHDLGARGIPVFPVPVGLDEPDDVSIRNIVMQEVAFSGDRVPVQVQLLSKGYEKRAASLSVTINDRQVSRQRMRLEGGLQFENIDFNVDLYEKGAARIAVTIEPFDDEVSTVNNRVERSVRVVNEKDQRALHRGQRPLGVPLPHRDPQARPAHQRHLHRHVGRAGVRPQLAGIHRALSVEARGRVPVRPRHPRRRRRRSSPTRNCACSRNWSGPRRLAADALRPDARARQASPGPRSRRCCRCVSIPKAPGRTHLDESVYPVLTPEGRSSLVMVLETDRGERPHLEPRRAARPPAAAARRQARRHRAGHAFRLAHRGSSRYPLVAWQRYGTGKCMSIGTDRLWLLRFKTGDKYHWRVWSQCIQFLTLSRLMGEHKRIRLETDRAIYPMTASRRDSMPTCSTRTTSRSSSRRSRSR
jgi:hypothetical protein